MPYANPEKQREANRGEYGCGFDSVATKDYCSVRSGGGVRCGGADFDRPGA